MPFGIPVDGYTLTETAARKGEIYVGYRHVGEGNTNVVANPLKSDTVMFDDQHQLIGIAEN